MIMADNSILPHQGMLHVGGGIAGTVATQGDRKSSIEPQSICFLKAERPGDMRN